MLPSPSLRPFAKRAALSRWAPTKGEGRALFSRLTAAPWPKAQASCPGYRRRRTWPLLGDRLIALEFDLHQTPFLEREVEILLVGAAVSGVNLLEYPAARRPHYA